MSTWHQDQNPGNVSQLWKPHPVRYKCISDRPGQMASCMLFATKGEAEHYAKTTGHVVIPPKVEHP